MARIDKYDPKVGGYRASLAAAWPTDMIEQIVGVGHDANGRVVIGAGNSGIKGVCIFTNPKKAGERIDVMTNGEVVEFGPTGVEAGEEFGLPGKTYYADQNGNVMSATDEVQDVTVTNTANPFTLTVAGQTTANIAGTASINDVKTALEALSNVAPGDVFVTDAPGAPQYRIVFGGAFNDSNVATITASNATVAVVTEGGSVNGLVKIGHTERADRLIVRVA